jgi:YidC/Oxa1 family membrane protein insertase
MDSIFGPLYEAFGWVLSFIYGIVPNLGVAIIILTAIVMMILYPLTAKQAKSMIAMQRVQPEVKKLQAKYKGDRQKLNEEMMTFYKENKINPLAGCLPLVVQLPVFIALNGTLRNAYKYVPTDGDLFAKLCHGVEKTCSADNFHHLKFLTMDLQKSATDSHGGFGSSAPYFVLVVFVMVTSLLQTRQATKRTPAANKQMGAVMKVLPIFFGLISLSFPAGLVLYFFVSNLFRLGQQELIFRRHGSALHGPGGKAIDVKSRDGSGKQTAVKELIGTEDVEDMTGDDGDVEDYSPSAPPQIVRKPAPKQSSPAASSASGSEAPAEVESGARPRGLRGLFALPPPPEYNGGGTGSSGSTGKPSSGQRSGAAGSGNGRPPQQRRRSNKKKRKR